MSVSRSVPAPKIDYFSDIYNAAMRKDFEALKTILTKASLYVAYEEAIYPHPNPVAQLAADDAPDALAFLEENFGPLDKKALIAGFAKKEDFGAINKILQGVNNDEVRILINIVITTLISNRFRTNAREYIGAAEALTNSLDEKILELNIAKYTGYAKSGFMPPFYQLKDSRVAIAVAYHLAVNANAHCFTLLNHAQHNYLKQALAIEIARGFARSDHLNMLNELDRRFPKWARELSIAKVRGFAESRALTEVYNRTDQFAGFDNELFKAALTGFFSSGFIGEINEFFKFYLRKFTEHARKIIGTWVNACVDHKCPDLVYEQINLATADKNFKIYAFKQLIHAYIRTEQLDILEKLVTSENTFQRETALAEMIFHYAAAGNTSRLQYCFAQSKNDRESDMLIQHILYGYASIDNIDEIKNFLMTANNDYESRKLFKMMIKAYLGYNNVSRLIELSKTAKTLALATLFGKTLIDEFLKKDNLDTLHLYLKSLSAAIGSELWIYALRACARQTKDKPFNIERLAELINKASDYQLGAAIIFTEIAEELVQHKLFYEALNLKTQITHPTMSLHYFPIAIVNKLSKQGFTNQLLRYFESLQPAEIAVLTEALDSDYLRSEIFKSMESALRILALIPNAFVRAAFIEAIFKKNLVINYSIVELSQRAHKLSALVSEQVEHNAEQHLQFAGLNTQTLAFLLSFHQHQSHAVLRNAGIYLNVASFLTATVITPTLANRAVLKFFGDRVVQSHTDGKTEANAFTFFKVVDDRKAKVEEIKTLQAAAGLKKIGIL